jgi:hypothetical protein
MFDKRHKLEMSCRLIFQLIQLVEGISLSPKVIEELREWGLNCQDKAMTRPPTIKISC